MNQPSQIVNYLHPTLEYGTITQILSDTNFEVELSFGTVKAIKAAGCLMQPEMQDLVLMSVDTKGSCYILNVLEKNNSAGQTQLLVPGDCILESRSGSISITAQEVGISATDNITIAGSSITVGADRADLAVSSITLVSRMLHSQIKRVTMIAKSVEQSMKRFTQRTESSERFVEQHEEVQTGSTRYLVEDTLTTQAGNTLNISEELHTMHAEQIHMS